MTITNKRWIFARPPAGEIETGNFELGEAPVPELREGEVLSPQQNCKNPYHSNNATFSWE